MFIIERQLRGGTEQHHQGFDPGHPALLPATNSHPFRKTGRAQDLFCEWMVLFVVARLVFQTLLILVKDFMDNLSYSTK